MVPKSRASTWATRHCLALVSLQLLLTTVIVSCDVVPQRERLPKTFDFGAYVQKYGKTYCHAETLSRANLFYARTMGIFKLNSLYAAHKTDHFLKQNEYTDMTPGEMRRSLLLKNSDLVPVRGADVSPNAPADQFSAEDDGILDGFSKSNLNETPRRKPVVDFFSKPKDVKARKLVRKLAQDLETAQRLSKIIEVGGAPSNLEVTKSENKIPFKPVVKAENSNYDPSLVPSFAWFDDTDRATDSFANYMMEDFLGNLEPYPRPRIPSSRVIKDENLPPKMPSTSMFSDFMDSVRDFYDYFSRDDTVVIDGNKIDDEDDDENEDPSKQQPSDVTPSPSSGPARGQAAGEIVFDIDWRRTGCIPRPKSQSKCNACYAFATLDLMEFFYCRQKKTLTEFSVQYVIDCGSKSELNGCQGGKLSSVGMFVQKYGLQLNSAYPYRALEHECPYDQQSDEEEKSWALKPTISGWRMFSEIQAWYKWLPKSPIIVGINMPSDFLAYGGGVHDGADCTPGMVHAMLLVGSGKQDGKPFWLLKNTFADTWGEAGYFRLSKKAPIKCFNSAIVARVSFQ